MNNTQAPEYGKPTPVSAIYSQGGGLKPSGITLWILFAGDYYRVFRIVPHFGGYMVAFENGKGGEACAFLASDDVLYVTQRPPVLMPLPMTTTTRIGDWLRDLLRWLGLSDRREG